MGNVRGDGCRMGFAALAGLALSLFPAVAHPSLAPSEREQVCHEISTAQNLGHVRSLVARPDLTSGEAAAAMISAMSSTPIDASHAAFLHELVFTSASAAARPTLAVAVVRGLLSRADTLLAKRNAGVSTAPRPPDAASATAPGLRPRLDATALVEVERAYALVEDVVAADPRANVTAAARDDCGHAIAEHISRNPDILRPDAPVSPGIASVRAQVAIALLDAWPNEPGRRVDVANVLALSGPRRAALVELGILLLDGGDSDVRIAALRSLIDRLPGAIDGVEAVVAGDERPSQLRGRFGSVLAIDAVPPAPLMEAASPWGSETVPPPVDATTMAAARRLSSSSVHHALDRSPLLRAAVERDGGETAVSTWAAMLAIDAPRTLDTAAARFLIGRRESAAWLSDATGALAAYARPSKGGDGLVVPLGKADAANGTALKATRVVLDPAGSVLAMRLEGHTWRFVRDDRGEVIALTRDGAPVSAQALTAARPPASQGSSWKGGGLIFARLAGSPRAVVTAGPRVWVYGSTPFDAIAAPSPGDDVVIDADLRVQGGPAGVVLRAVPEVSDALKGVSLLIAPGSTPRAALLVGGGASFDAAAGPIVELTSAPVYHVRLAVKGTKVEASIGSVHLQAVLPQGLEHGDVALRAYPGASLEVSGWSIRRY